MTDVPGAERLPVDRMADGTWLYAPLGTLLQTADGEAVICHVCGEPLTWLSSAHLARHGLTPPAYRERFGLNRKQALASTAMLGRRAAEGSRRYRDNPALRDGLATGQQMAKDGHLNVLGVNAQPPGSRRTQGRQTVTRGAAAPALTAARQRTSANARQRWTQAATSLGFANLEAYLIDRVVTGAGTSTIRRELGTGGPAAQRLLQEVRDLHAQQTE